MEFLKEIVNNEKVGNAFFNLFDRWRDESEYEDINDYGKAIVNTIAKQFPSHEIELAKSTKKPFGVKIKTDCGAYKLWVKFKGGYVSVCGQKI